MTMQTKAKTLSLVAALIVSAGAGAGITTAIQTAPAAASAPALERLCIEADGSAQLYAATSSPQIGVVARRQLLVPPDHALAIMARDGKKIADKVPAALSAAIKATLLEAGKVAASSSK